MKQKLAFALSLSLLVGMLFVAPTTQVVAADNLAANGDLEIGNTSGWEIANASIDSSVKYAGNYSLKLTSTAAYSGAAYKIVPVGKGATVTVSFYYRYESNPGSNTYHVYTYQGENANAGPYSNADKSFAVPSGCDSISTWKQVSYTFNSGDYAHIYLKFCPGGNGSSACYIDNLVVTATGGTEEKVAPYLTSFGTKYNRPSSDANNLIKNGGFESADNAQWNTSTFIKNGLNVVEDASAKEGDKSLALAPTGNGIGVAPVYTFPVTVEKYTQYTFSSWVKAPRLSVDNDATATFGVANAETGEFLVYEPYNGDGYGKASLSTPEMQLMATSPDGEWHLRSVTFYSGTASVVNVAVSGVNSRLYLDDMALYKSAHGIEYVSELRTHTISTATNTGYKYCADEHSLIPAPHMTGETAERHWSDNPAWRNGFLSFEETGDSHKYVLKYTASAKTNLKLTYVDWIDVLPDTAYTLTMDVKRLTAGEGKIVLLDDDYDSPKEFYSVSFRSTDSDWKTYSITFNTGAYSRVGFAIVDGGGSAYIDKTRLFMSALGVAEEPEDEALPVLRPLCSGTSVMELGADKRMSVAFLMDLEALGVTRNEKSVGNLDNATVDVYADGEAYSLKAMGAMLTNSSAVGRDKEAFRKGKENPEGRVVDVPAVYLWDTSDTNVSYAVRIIDIPPECADVVLYARPYYVFEKNGQEIVVYGDVYSRSYNNSGNDIYLD